ncbi:MAG: transporter substrate-binding domain-containing protein [Candidatus Pacebacteria bacterium]|nr:transporter substrate-binding domain-containing protein [Candidatus Paceibacterota bacterium]
MKKVLSVLGFLILFVTVANPLFAQNKDILSSEEVYWLGARNNTIVVYPEDNNPPYSYKNSAGNIQGLSIDYLELIGDKLGIKIQYLTPRSRTQILSDIKSGKGDVVASLSPDVDQEQFVLFTGNYVSSTGVIVVRKDYDKRTGLNLNDFAGKRVAVVNDSSLESYMRKNYPRVIIEEVTDNEIGLQQVVLGEVEASAMDVASLSYFLSKQVLSSVKVVGNTGYEYKPSFGVSKGSAPLQSILEKGLSQISQSERELISAKWISLPQEQKQDETLIAHIQNNISITSLYILFGIGIIAVLAMVFKRRGYPIDYFRMPGENPINTNGASLEKSNSMITEELRAIREEEERLAKKLDSINNSNKVNNNPKDEGETLKESSSIE